MPSRTLHNLINAMILGFSANDLHAYMDRFAKEFRHKHRDVGGHDLAALIQMIFMFKHKYSVADIIKAYLIHKSLDGSLSGLQAAVRAKNKGYGRKDSTMEIINKLKEELFRI
ncbi:hypothetical protein LCGC14_0741650 [marine sediment metagenome]|uniref:Uncharacterized protein n=1 Tax=marine sediment metagenome TaxID=412755 RepID=A0A0F9SRG4_9ZZZZ